MKSKAVFLDRDGTINVDGPYLSDPDKFLMYPGVGEGVKRLQDAGFKIIVITNQSGIARGYFTEDDLAAVHERMKKEFARFGVTLDGIYYCPHHPDAGCKCRKPNTGLFVAAIAEHNIDPQISYMIGDKPLDIIAGGRIGAKTVLVSGEVDRAGSSGSFPDFSAPDFAAAVKVIVSDEE
jgi:D,D-heptose 1,7-bisphosphate phosphatase